MMAGNTERVCSLVTGASQNCCQMSVPWCTLMQRVAIILYRNYSLYSTKGSWTWFISTRKHMSACIRLQKYKAIEYVTVNCTYI